MRVTWIIPAFIFSALASAASATDIPSGECLRNGQYFYVRQKDGGMRVPTLEECMGPCQHYNSVEHGQCIQRANGEKALCFLRSRTDCSKQYKAALQRCDYHKSC